MHWKIGWLRRMTAVRIKSAGLVKAAGLITAVGVITTALLTGCGTADSGAFDPQKEIGVISREDGSGTRGAFIELFEIEKKDENGEKIDHTTDEAIITNSTSVMITSVMRNEFAIGYISLGTMSDAIKALQIDGVEATAENILSGEYKIARPFQLAVKEPAGAQTQDFIEFILSSDGQKIVEKAGYVSVSDAGPYEGDKPAGKIVVAGSSSVSPVMEKLKEAYLAINPDAVIEVQQSDSTTGMTSAVEGICDIGMASRNLKDSELAAGLTPIVIAKDGIVIVVNHGNAVDGLTGEQVRSIFTGEITQWSEVSSQNEEGGGIQ